MFVPYHHHAWDHESESEASFSSPLVIRDILFSPRSFEAVSVIFSLAPFYPPFTWYRCTEPKDIVAPISFPSSSPSKARRKSEKCRKNWWSQWDFSFLSPVGHSMAFMSYFFVRPLLISFFFSFAAEKTWETRGENDTEHQTRSTKNESHENWDEGKRPTLRENGPDSIVFLVPKRAFLSCFHFMAAQKRRRKRETWRQRLNSSEQRFLLFPQKEKQINIEMCRAISAEEREGIKHKELSSL